MKKHRSVRITKRHAYRMGYLVACMLNVGGDAPRSDNPFPLASDNHKAWHEGFSLARHA